MKYLMHYPIIRCCGVQQEEIGPVILAITWIQAHVWAFRIVGALVVIVVLYFAVLDLLKVLGSLIHVDENDIKY